MTNDTLESRKKEKKYVYALTVSGRKAHKLCKGETPREEKEAEPGFTHRHSKRLTLRPGLWALFLFGCISDARIIQSCHFPRTLNTSVLQKEIGNIPITPITIEHFWRNQQPQSGDSWYHSYIQIIKAVSLGRKI